jgi:hypothetical protein
MKHTIRVISGVESRFYLLARVTGASIAIVGDLNPVVYGPLEGGNYITVVSPATFQSFKSIDTGFRGDADNTKPIVRGGYGTGDMGAVTVNIHGVSIIINEIPAALPPKGIPLLKLESPVF